MQPPKNRVECRDNGGNGTDHREEKCPLENFVGPGSGYDRRCHSRVSSAIHFGPRDSPTGTLRLRFCNLGCKFLVGTCSTGFVFPTRSFQGLIIDALPLFEIASVLVRFDHVASFIVNADRSIL
jgi:hypothetical protein